MKSIDLKKRIGLEEIIGISVSKTSNEFVLHLNIYEIDYNYESPRKNEIISTIAESYYKFQKSKLKFAYIDKDSLREFVTSKGQKYYDTSST